MHTKTARSERQAVCGDTYSIPACSYVFPTFLFGTTLTKTRLPALLRANGILPMISLSDAVTTTRTKRVRTEDEPDATSSRKRRKPLVSEEIEVSVNGYSP